MRFLIIHWRCWARCCCIERQEGFINLPKKVILRIRIKKLNSSLFSFQFQIQNWCPMKIQRMPNTNLLSIIQHLKVIYKLFNSTFFALSPCWVDVNGRRRSNKALEYFVDNREWEQHQKKRGKDFNGWTGKEIETTSLAVFPISGLAKMKSRRMPNAGVWLLKSEW